MKNDDIFYLDAAERSPKWRLEYGMKIKKLRLLVGDLRIVLILRCYVIAAKKAQSGMPSAWPTTHIEVRKNAGMRF
jgi:hypothetical protein